MTRTSYRIVQQRHAENAMDGEGARLYGGRWNSRGTRMVYTASSVSLAILEMLVHLDEIQLLHSAYVVIAVEFEDTLVEAVKKLPPNALGPQLIVDTQLLGDRWLATGKMPVLSVPSAVTPSELNYLINPMHRDFGQLRAHRPSPLYLDERLLRGR